MPIAAPVQALSRCSSSHPARPFSTFSVNPRTEPRSVTRTEIESQLQTAVHETPLPCFFGLDASKQIADSELSDTHLTTTG